MRRPAALAVTLPTRAAVALGLAAAGVLALVAGFVVAFVVSSGSPSGRSGRAGWFDQPPSQRAPVATVQDIMRTLVDPSAEILFEVATSLAPPTTFGAAEGRFGSEQDWADLQPYANRLLAAAQLLSEPGRPVARAGRALQDPWGLGPLSAAQVRRLIDADPAAFASRSQALGQAAAQLQAAIAARDSPRLREAATRLDQACEACHRRYAQPEEEAPTPMRHIGLVGPDPRASVPRLLLVAHGQDHCRVPTDAVHRHIAAVAEVDHPFPKFGGHVRDGAANTRL
jgi:hypothetical protein